MLLHTNISPNPFLCGMNYPKQTGEIFELLSKGQFICSNSVQDNTRRLYNSIEEHFEQLHEYFAAIGFVLEAGDEFYYFSRSEQRADLERKIEQAFRWIDIVDFCKAFDNAFGPGYRFSASQIDVRIRLDASLKDKLEMMKKITGEGSFAERIRKLVDEMDKYGIVEMENEILQQYKVLSAFKYLEQLIVTIQITEEA